MTDEERMALMAESLEQMCKLVQIMEKLLTEVLQERDSYKDMLQALQATMGEKE